jgi:hypothetical protein
MPDKDGLTRFEARQSAPALLRDAFKFLLGNLNRVLLTATAAIVATPVLKCGKFEREHEIRFAQMWLFRGA